MRKFIFGLLMAIASTQAFAIETLGPGTCTFFNALTFSADRNSDDVAAWAKPFDLRFYRGVSFHVLWAGLTGTIDGSCKVQVSNKRSPTGTDWVDKSGATFTFVGATGSDMISISTVQEAYYRLACPHGNISGGTITGYCMAKE